MTYKTILVEKEGPVCRIIMNRPHVHNAFNENMIPELGKAFRSVGKDDSIRAVIFTGSGASFCAGADLNWMGGVRDYSFEENLRESNVLAETLYSVYTCARPTVARVTGAAIGGGAGLMSACDIVVAAVESKISLSEVKLGLVPACIAPYVMKRIGERGVRELFLTGERIDGQGAYDLRLVNKVVPLAELDEAVSGIVKRLLSSGPEAIRICKTLIRRVAEMSLEEAKPYTALEIAKLRVSEEAQEGMAAFFEKRKPKWTTD